jgi:hypothetical protein
MLFPPPPMPDYTATAILALFLYFVCYFPGLFYTIFKLVDALQWSNYYRSYYGRRSAGISCLQWLLVGGSLGPIIVVGGYFIALYYAFPPC